ncbi:PepSY domain-containing protein [Inhella sp. 1Y17]|uniref:PepSY domain-containing protein n=1 Tax=Inhella proteolytica TaxID=2795029 RepID=A0A931J3W4_9BURK|nr:PepSY domain-containing protein [Inhella proteolytica]
MEAKAQDRDGRWVKLELDGRTGAVLHSKPGSAPRDAQASGLDFGQLLSQLEAAGYRAVQKIERERDRVEVRAEDAQGRRVKLALDPQTGAVRSR